MAAKAVVVMNSDVQKSDNLEGEISSKPYQNERLKAAYDFLSTISLDGRHLDCRPPSLLQEKRKSFGASTDDNSALLDEVAEEGKATQFLHHSYSMTCAEVSHGSSKSHATARCDVFTTGNINHYPSTIGRTQSLIDPSLLNDSRIRHINAGNIDELKTMKKSLIDKRIAFATQQQIPHSVFSVIGFKKTSKSQHRANSTLHHQSDYLRLEGIEIGEGKKSVSYGHLLVPADKYSSDVPIDTVDSLKEYVSDLHWDIPAFDNLEFTTGVHKKVLKLESFLVSVIFYAKPSDMKRNVNSQFRERFPNINITFSKMQSLKREMHIIGQKCSLDNATISCGILFFEKIVLQGRVNKINRNQCAGACLLLAAKFYDDDWRGTSKPIVRDIADQLKIHARDLLHFEFQVLVSLEFSLFMTLPEMIGTFKRLEGRTN